MCRFPTGVKHSSYATAGLYFFTTTTTTDHEASWFPYWIEKIRPNITFHSSVYSNFQTAHNISPALKYLAAKS
jgi:hypothetical protein